MRGTINACARLLYALRVLGAHGMRDVALQAVYQVVLIAKLVYAASAWWRFTTSANQLIDNELNLSFDEVCAVDFAKLTQPAAR